MKKFWNISLQSIGAFIVLVVLIAFMYFVLQFILTSITELNNSDQEPDFILQKYIGSK